MQFLFQLKISYFHKWFIGEKKKFTKNIRIWLIMCDDINLEKVLIRNSNHMSLTFFTLPAQPFPTHKLHNELIEIGNNVRNQTNETRSFSARKKKKEKKN